MDKIDQNNIGSGLSLDMVATTLNYSSMLLKNEAIGKFLIMMNKLI